MKVLGINTGMGASICLLDDGQIAFAIEEERLSRVKNPGGFPELSLRYVNDHYSDFLQEMDYVAICDLEDQVTTREELRDRYRRRFREPERSSLKNIGARTYAQVSSLIPEPVKARLKSRPPGLNLAEKVRNCLPGLSLPDEKFRRLRHHDCHASAAYFGLARDYDRPYLVLTLDGGGDGECASVSIGRRGRLARVATTPSGNSVANLYSGITYLLGFTPHEHEYKVMGLAPYVPDGYADPVKEILSRYLRLDQEKGLAFERLTPEKTTWVGLRLKEDLKYLRFDNIAAGLQAYTEDLVLQWAANAIGETGVSDLLLSGGVFMNVKLNKKIAEMEQVGSVDVFPSCGDESNAIGIAFQTWADNGSRGLPKFGPYTLGPTPIDDLEIARNQFANQCDFEEVEDPNRLVAQLLAQGHVVARCSGPMEFGARALGNRSILADPIVPGVIERINRVIKQRDFWMPFAPAILEEDTEKYLFIPESLPKRISPYMMFTFDTTARRNEMIAALHQSDKSARAQIVGRDYCPDLHAIISAFKELTGRSAILNTSFNLHGHPIVLGTVDAVDILLKSDLEYLVVEDVLIRKR